MKRPRIVETQWLDIPVGTISEMESCSICYSMDTLLRSMITIDWNTGESSIVFFGNPGTEPLTPPATITSKAF